MAKIFIIIDALGTGGSQTQAVNLAIELKEREYDIRVLHYSHQTSKNEENLNAAAIPIVKLGGIKNRFSIIYSLIKNINAEKPCALISFVRGANIYGTLARLLSAHRFQLIISERNGISRSERSSRSISRWLTYFFCDHVVTNTFEKCDLLTATPFLKGKVRVIYNGMARKKLGPTCAAEGANDCKNTLCVLSRVHYDKNPVRLARALLLFQNSHGWCPRICWAGRREYDENSIQAFNTVERIKKYFPKDSWLWLGELHDVDAVLLNSGALIHPSTSEGMPNAILESFQMRRLVLAAAIADNRTLLADGDRGILFDPLCEVAIYEAIREYITMTQSRYTQCVSNAHQFVIDKCSISRMADDYMALLK